MTGTAQELEDKIMQLQEELAASRAEEKMAKVIEKQRKESMDFQSKIHKLQSSNRQHKRRESEVFTQIGTDAKDVVKTYEELEARKKEMEDKELQLQYLIAEKQRMQIAYEHARTNTAKAKQQAAEMKKK